MQNQMRRGGFILGLISIGLLATAALTFSPASAQTTSVGPYYATPSWDQTLPAATRFIVLSNFAGQAVLDRNTGLVWEKTPSSITKSWTNAKDSCINSSIGGQRAWRLPSVVELSSLLDPSVTSPQPPFPLSLSPGHPFQNVQTALYWSATAYPESPDNRAWAWAVMTSVDFVTQGAFSGSTFNYWCVRGGMNADTY